MTPSICKPGFPLIPWFILWALPVAAFADFEPALPTTQWPAKGFVREGPMPIALPADAAPGKYQVWVGMFTPGGDRVQLDNADRLRGQREYLAGEFEVVPPATATGAKEARFDLLPVEEGALVRAPARAAVVIADAGAKTFSVTDFGAKPDDGQDDTAKKPLPVSSPPSCCGRAYCGST